MPIYWNQRLPHFLKPVPSQRPSRFLQALFIASVGLIGLSLASCITVNAEAQPMMPLAYYNQPTSISQPPARYLDRMALVDAGKDYTQSPSPGYVLDAPSVLRFPQNYPIGMVIIGDSILTGWSGYFAHVFPNALISGRVGRQFSSALPIWKDMQQDRLTQNVGTVVIELGTNGEVYPEDMEKLLEMLGPRRQVCLVMPEMPRSWEQEVQQLYLQTAATYPNVHLVRWDLLSENHPQYFWTDQVHPNWMGIQVMAHAIAWDVQGIQNTGSVSFRQTR